MTQVPYLKLGIAVIMLIFLSFFSEVEAIAKEGKVLVEPTYVAPVRAKKQYNLVPYRKRRKKWGAYYGLSYAQFFPENYEPDGFSASFENVYGEDPVGLSSFDWNIKRNFSWSSFGIEGSIGYSQKDSKGSFSGSTLKVTQIRLGMQWTIDTLFSEPYVVPYASGGGYVVVYEEKRSGVEFGGSTQVAPYWTAGLLLQIDWWEPRSARTAFEENGVQNTFLYAEVESLLVSEEARDPDFSSLHGAAGVKLEF